MLGRNILTSTAFIRAVWASSSIWRHLCSQSKFAEKKINMDNDPDEMCGSDGHLSSQDVKAKVHTWVFTQQIVIWWELLNFENMEPQNCSWVCCSMCIYVVIAWSMLGSGIPCRPAGAVYRWSLHLVLVTLAPGMLSITFPFLPPLVPKG